MTILYEDAQLIVCVKPRGILSAGDASGKSNMSRLLAPRTTFPVHRLDCDTCGVMVFAKTSSEAASLSSLMQRGEFQKEYLVLCDAAPTLPEAVLEDLLYHDRARNKTYVVQRTRAGVRQARLDYRTLRQLPDGRALLHVRLRTGRTHQIRVQLSSRKCPVCGDRKNGAVTSGDLQLYAWRLTFPFPNGEYRTFTLPDEYLPEELNSSHIEA